MISTPIMAKNKIGGGDLIEVTTTAEKISGAFIPNPKQDVVILKLDNGYNIGVDKKNIKQIKIIKKYKCSKLKKEKIKTNKNLPWISILHTGGTIASSVDYKTGGVIAQFTPERLLAQFPEMKDIANIRTVFVKNIMSEDIRFDDYRLLTKNILSEIKKGAKGLIIGHGTDTLAYTAAALSFIFENLPIPVILVGAQRSSDRGSSDATMNLICAAKFITKTDFCGVAICMHENVNDDNCLILPATKTRKLHTSRRDAFKAVNDKPIARVSYAGNIYFFKKNYPKKIEKIIVRDKFEERVGILKTHPNMHPAIFEFFRKNKYKGLILEGTGIGQAPTNIKEHQRNYNALKNFIKSGGVVVLTSQCIFGEVHPFIYAYCRRLFDIGIIFGKDMLTETAFIKLAWLLGNYPKERVKTLITENLRGEISKRLELD